MTVFDPIKAQREIVGGLREIHNLIRRRSNTAQAALDAAEAEVNAMMKLERFSEDQLVAATAKLRELEEAEGRVG